MTRAEWFAKLPNAVLDRMAAEAQGWTEPNLKWNIWHYTAGGSTGYSVRDEECPPHPVYDPSSDLNQAAEFEAFVIGKVGAAVWFGALTHVCELTYGKEWHAWENQAKTIRADAKTRVIAGLLALEAQNETH